MQFQKDGEIGFKHAIYLLSTKLYLRSFTSGSGRKCPRSLTIRAFASYHDLFEEGTMLPTIKKEQENNEAGNSSRI
jgi:hypothetical protein